MLPGSSMVEHSAVNRGVAGSSPARGANVKSWNNAFAKALFCYGEVHPRMRFKLCNFPIAEELGLV